MKQMFIMGPKVARGIVKLQFPFSRAINEELKKFPGVRPVYDSSATGGEQGVHGKFLYWQGPIELVKEYKKVAHAYRLEWETNLDSGGAVSWAPYSPHLMAHQTAAVIRCLEEQSHLVSFQTGGGKTAVALEVLRIVAPIRALIVCPANAKPVWEAEINKWIPNLASKFGFVYPGKDVPETPYLVVNYELLSKVPLVGYDLIVADELHYVANGGEGGSKRAKTMTDIARFNPNAWRIGLTATPIFTDPKQFFYQGDFLFPDRFGNFGHFIKRYSGKTENVYADSGYSYAGLDKTHAEEFNARVASICSRATAEEYGEYLPPFTIDVHRVAAPVKFDPEEYIKKVLSGAMPVGSVVRHHTQTKLTVARDMIAEAAKTTQRVIALTHYRDSAEQLKNALSGAGIDAVLLTGSMTVKKRVKVLETALSKPSCVVVATMHCVKEAIDLTKFTKSFIVELHWSSGLISQVLGRFYRLNSLEPASSTIVIVKGSAEEKIAGILEQRFADTEAIYKSTAVESNTAAGLKDDRGDEEFLAHLSEMCGQADFSRVELFNDQEEE